ncbi:MAG: magnesium/cobalt transporter CorA [Actinomycetota bacterium]
MLTCHLYRSGEFHGEVPVEKIPELLEQDEHARVWIDAVRPDEDDLEAIDKVVKLHSLTIEDALHWNQRSKIEFFETYFTVVIHALELSDEDVLIDREVHVFVHPRVLTTLRKDPGRHFPGILAHIKRMPGLIKEGPAALLYMILDSVIDEYLTIAEHFEDVSDALEDRVFGDETGQAVQRDLFRIKREVTIFRRAVAPAREIIDVVGDQPDFQTPRLAPYYRDLQDHVLRTLEFIDNVRELLQSALEAQLSQVSNRTNIIMKRVTSWGSILLVPTLISGIYGMNFAYMPELDWKFGYPMALVLMFGAAYALFRMFRRRDWL